MRTGLNGLFDKLFLWELQEMSCMLAVNESNLHLFDLSHCGATSFGGNWNPSDIYAERDPLPHILSCHCLRVPLWLHDRLSGVLRQTAVWEKGAWGMQWGALDSCLLSSQSSLFIFLLRIAWSTLQCSMEGVFWYNTLLHHLLVLSFGVSWSGTRIYII